MYLDHGRGTVDGRALEDVPPGIWYVKPGIRAQVHEGSQPAVSEHVAHRIAVAAAHHGGQRPEMRAEQLKGVLGGCLERLASLVGAPAREALLALPTGLRASLHVPAADLRGDDRPAGQQRDGKAALPDQKQAPVVRSSDRLRERSHVGCSVVRLPEGQEGATPRAVGCRSQQAAGLDAAFEKAADDAVPLSEVAEPPLDPGCRDEDGAWGH